MLVFSSCSTRRVFKVLWLLWMGRCVCAADDDATTAAVVAVAAAAPAEEATTES